MISCKNKRMDKKGMRNSDAKILYGIIALMLVLILMAGCTAQTQSIDKTVQAKTPSTLVNEKKEIILSENKTGYQKTRETVAAVLPNGIYSRNVSYAFHSGVNMVDITVTVKDDIITNASVIALNKPDKVSAFRIKSFNDALPDLAVGKNISQLNIPVQVAGSSLTTAAFKQYVDGLVKK